MAGITDYTGRLLPDISKSIVDHYFKARPTYGYFYKRKKTWKGGLEKRTNRITTTNGTTVAVDLTTTSLAGPTTLSSTLSAAQYKLVGYRTPVSLTWEAQLKSKGSLAIISEIENIMTQAYKEHYDFQANDFMNGNGSSNAALGIVSIMTLNQIYGNVDPTLETDWQPKTVSASTPLTGSMQITGQITLIRDAGDRPNIGFTGDNNYIRLQSFAAQASEIEGAQGEEANLGWDYVKINGVKFVDDKDWVSGNLSIFTDKYIELWVDDVFDYRFSGFVNPKGEIYLTGDIRSAWLLYLESRRRQGGFTATTL